MEPAIRTADPDDAELISALAVETWVAAFGHSLSAADLRAQVQQELSPAAFARAMRGDVVLLAELSRRLVGYVQFGAARAADSWGADAELRRLYVDVAFQSRGIGSRLMEAALAHPLLGGARAVALDVWVQNERARRFYGRHGFRAVAEREFEVASGGATTPDVIMVRRAPPDA